jgi:hypothetical protein
MSERKLDAEIAEKVFGHTWFRGPKVSVHGEALIPRYRWLNDKAYEDDEPCDENDILTLEVSHGDGLHYSTDISAAFQVVEKMRERGYFFGLILEENGKWNCEYTDSSYELRGETENAPSAPEAICRAALSAISKEQGR